MPSEEILFEGMRCQGGMIVIFPLTIVSNVGVRPSWVFLFLKCGPWPPML